MGSKAFAEIANLYMHEEFRRTGKTYIILQAMILDSISVHIQRLTASDNHQP